jgi:hypothetical protein
MFDRRERMTRSATLDCEDDDTAVKSAEMRRGPARMELWRGGKLIRGFPAER